MLNYEFMNNMGNFPDDGITFEKLEALAESLNFKYEPHVLQEMIKVS